MYIVVILLGTSVGATTSAEAFLNIQTIKIVILGLAAFAFGTAAGVLFGTAGIKVLSSKDAKKVYTETTAAALRAKECVMTTVTTIKENANDILTDAKEINEQRAADAAAEVIEDAACACTEEAASAEESTEA